MITRDIIEDAYDSIEHKPGTRKFCDNEAMTACGMGAIYIAETGDTDTERNDESQEKYYGARLMNYMQENHGVTFSVSWGIGFDRAMRGETLGEEDTYYPEQLECRKNGYEMGLFVRDVIAGKTRELIHA